jgi:FG-GAP-like repeat/FG-GAP repeat
MSMPPISIPMRNSLDVGPRRLTAVALGAIAFVWLTAATIRPALAEPLYPRPFFEVGDQAVGIAAADLNADGLPDLVVGARRNYDGCAAILLGGVRSVLRDAGCLPVGGDPLTFAIADFDGDGHADIAAGWQRIVVPQGGGVAIFLGNGDGTFREGDRIDAGVVGSLATGDFDGDGIPDLAVATRGNGADAPYAALLRGHGDGSFGPIAQFASDLVGLVAADFDGDGLSDLATIDGSQSHVNVYLGSPSGALVLKVSYDVGQGPEWIVAADFDEDGHIDLAVGFVQDQQVRILLGRGNGFLTAQPPLALGEGAGPMAAGDFDGDGHPDVAVARTVGQGVTLLAGDGSGGLAQAGFADAAADGLAAADFDGDGLPDLAATSGAGVALLRAFGDFSVPANITVSSGPVLRGATAGDFNRDGRDDLAVFYYATGDIYISFGRSDGTFLDPVELEPGIGQQLLRVGDFNRDGNLDLASIGGGAVVILLGNGRGGFASPRTTFLPGFLVQDGAAGDIDGDGFDDVVVVGRISATVGVGYALALLAGPDGTLQPPTYWDAGHQPRSVAIGDLDGDGRADLAVVNREVNGGLLSPGSLTILAGAGGGIFGTPRTMPLDGFGEGIAAADLDGDAITDLVIAETGTTDTATGALAVLTGVGGGLFAPERHLAATRNPTAVVVYDVDGDGAPDLVSVGLAGGDVALLRGDGSGGFGSQEDYATGLSYQSLAVGDFSGRHRGDIALTNQNTSFTDGLVIVLPLRPPFPCLPAPSDEPLHCAQDVTDARRVSGAASARGAAMVAWRTNHEYDVTAFNLVELDHSGHVLQLNEAPIPCVECDGGGSAAYAFPVPRSSSSRDIYIELLRRSGPPRLFGPVPKG